MSFKGLRNGEKFGLSIVWQDLKASWTPISSMRSSGGEGGPFVAPFFIWAIVFQATSIVMPWWRFVAHDGIRTDYVTLFSGEWWRQEQAPLEHIQTIGAIHVGALALTAMAYVMRHRSTSLRTTWATTFAAMSFQAFAVFSAMNSPPVCGGVDCTLGRPTVGWIGALLALSFLLVAIGLLTTETISSRKEQSKAPLPRVAGAFLGASILAQGMSLLLPWWEMRTSDGLIAGNVSLLIGTSVRFDENPLEQIFFLIPAAFASIGLLVAIGALRSRKRSLQGVHAGPFSTHLLRLALVGHVLGLITSYSIWSLALCGDVICLASRPLVGWWLSLSAALSLFVVMVLVTIAGRHQSASRIGDVK